MPKLLNYAVLGQETAEELMKQEYQKQLETVITLNKFTWINTPQFVIDKVLAPGEKVVVNLHSFQTNFC